MRCGCYGAYGLRRRGGGVSHVLFTSAPFTWTPEGVFRLFVMEKSGVEPACQIAGAVTNRFSRSLPGKDFWLPPVRRANERQWMRNPPGHMVLRSIVAPQLFFGRQYGSGVCATELDRHGTCSFCTLESGRDAARRKPHTGFVFGFEEELAPGRVYSKAFELVRVLAGHNGIARLMACLAA